MPVTVLERNSINPAMKTNIVVAYHSITGTTAALAHGVLEGIATVDNAQPVELKIEGHDLIEGRYSNEASLDLITNAAGVVFGSPTFMGSVSAQFKAFADASSDLWADSMWSDKIAGGFTIGSNFSGDQLSSIQYMHLLASQHGMLWASLDLPGGDNAKCRNRLGSQSGLVAHSESGDIDPIDLETARYLGKRVAQLSQIMSRGMAGG